MPKAVIELINVNHETKSFYSDPKYSATAPNTTDVTRYSVEMRTINLADLKAGRGAPNIDNAGKPVRYNWYRHTVDSSSLSEAMS